MDRITLIAFLFSALGCVSIDGGAVEASWVVETYGDGRGIADCGCACPPIAKMRLKLEPMSGGSDPCEGRSTCEFSCNLKTGATRFDIPPGRYAISLVPVGEDGNDIANGSAQICGAHGVAPEVRDVLKGRVTELNAMLIEATCTAACGGSDSNRVCTK